MYAFALKCKLSKFHGDFGFRPGLESERVVEGQLVFSSVEQHSPPEASTCNVYRTGLSTGT